MNKGFTLVELAIVIVVIGILFTGILGAQSLINLSERRAIISEYNQYNTAISAFYLEYGQLPGDFDEAYEYWPNDCHPYHASSTYCNGNNDKKVTWWTGSGVYDVETLHAWRHLQLAEIIQGDFDATYPGNGQHVLDEDLPSSKAFEYAAWSFTYRQPYTDSTLQNYLILGSVAKTSTNVAGGGYNFFNGIKVSDALSIDKKLDDGIPNRGSIISIEYGLHAGDCTTTSGTAIVYEKSEDSRACHMYFKGQFR